MSFIALSRLTDPGGGGEHGGAEVRSIRGEQGEGSGRDHGDPGSAVMTTGGQQARSRWARYDAWNGGIEREFFSGQSADRPVYLDLEADVLARIAEAAGE